MNPFTPQGTPQGQLGANQAAAAPAAGAPTAAKRTPAAAIAAAFAAAAARQHATIAQENAAPAATAAADYHAASATPWGAQIATPRHFSGRGVAVTKQQVTARYSPMIQETGAGDSTAPRALSEHALPLENSTPLGVTPLSIPLSTPPDGGTQLKLVFDEDAKLQGERSRQRTETLVSNALALPQEAQTQFSLVEEGMTLVNIKPTTILEAESSENEADLIAGNVTVLEHLSTGTDNVSAVSVGASLPAEEGSGEPQVEPVSILPARLHVSSTLNLPNAGADRSPGVHLLPAILADTVRYGYVYLLALLLCFLCLLNVYQVQDTNTINARLNEVALSNEAIEREWLNLMAQRQTLSEHATVRDSAIYQLQMVAPQTEKEHVIYLKQK